MIKSRLGPFHQAEEKKKCERMDIETRAGELIKKAEEMTREVERRFRETEEFYRELGLTKEAAVRYCESEKVSPVVREKQAEDHEKWLEEIKQEVEKAQDQVRMENAPARKHKPRKSWSRL
jgi:hypothetical protein